MNTRFLVRFVILITCATLWAPTFAGGQAHRGSVGIRHNGGTPHRYAPSTPPRHHHGGYSHHYYRPYRHYGWGMYSFWGYPRYWDAYYRNQTGAVDLNVSPKHAQVYLNGSLVGKAAQFDGWPQYLWLPTGNHELIFSLDGYQTVRQEVEIVDGIVLRTHLSLEPGQTTPVAELSVPRQKREHERRDLYERYSKDRPRVVEPAAVPVPAPAGDSAPTSTPADTASVESAVLVLDVDPADAVVYLDGRLIGSAASLGAQGGKLTVAAGTHRLEVVRPGYANYITSLDAVAGKSLAISIRLTRL